MIIVKLLPGATKTDEKLQMYHCENKSLKRSPTDLRNPPNVWYTVFTFNVISDSKGVCLVFCFWFFFKTMKSYTYITPSIHSHTILLFMMHLYVHVCQMISTVYFLFNFTDMNERRKRNRKQKHDTGLSDNFHSYHEDQDVIFNLEGVASNWLNEHYIWSFSKWLSKKASQV